MHTQQRDHSTTGRAGGSGADGTGCSDGGHEVGVASAARNHRLLRGVNDRIAALAGEQNAVGVSLFVCECSDLACTDTLEMSPAEYAQLRAEASHFVVFPGHERPESEHVIERHGRFIVVADREPEERQPRGGEGQRDG
jgi:hypothetical protein